MSFDETEMTATEMDTEMTSPRHAMPAINRAVAKVAPAKVRKTAAAAKAPAKKASKPVTAQSKKEREREALKDRTNQKDQEMSDDDNMDESREQVEAPKSKKSRARKAEPAYDEPPMKKTKTAAPKAESRKKAVKEITIDDSRSVIPETQARESSPELDPLSPKVQRRPVSTLDRVRAISAQRAPVAPPRITSRERSVSDPNRRLAESDAKRRLNDMTSKYEDIKLKYEQLQDLGRSDAESNFDRLKRATDEKAKDAAELIASLKKELSDVKRLQTTASTEIAKQQTTIAAQTEEIERLNAADKALQMKSSESANEIKTLNAKLEAARKSAAESATRTPAVKDRGAVVLPANDSSADAYLREELYRDLTGLIINSVKRRDTENEFSCIQTGRNGTLHFHLRVPTVGTNTANVKQNPRTPKPTGDEEDEEAEGEEEDEFIFEPFLDQSRDRDLLDVLPEYLQEEISFPREVAARFMGKLLAAMSARVAIDE